METAKGSLGRVVVIHPSDASTDVFRGIYEAVSGAVVVRGGLRRSEAAAQCASAQCVVCVGHGTGTGLMAVGKFPGELFIVDESFVPVLASVSNAVLLWCNADVFVRRTQLSRVFFSGMFVSEVDEAIDEGLPGDAELVHESNSAFVRIAATHLQLLMDGCGVEAFHAAVVRDYGRIAKENPIAAFNCERLYVRN